MKSSFLTYIFFNFRLLACLISGLKADSSMPLPFYRELKLTDPLMSGNDVLIAQTLLLRDSAVDKAAMSANSIFASESTDACAAFQTANGLPSTGILDSASAQLLLDLHGDDGIKDSGFSAASMGYLYKFHIPVHSNRSIETFATLFDKDNNVLMKFKSRQHGHRGDGTTQSWPDFGDGDVGLTQFYSNGNTVTGLIEVDLNSPEPNPSLYGPWPVNRFVRGLEGNAQLLLPNIRDGILLHTGNWSTDSTGEWNPSLPMPNSSGCIHAHPSSIEQIYRILVKLGATVNPNTYSGKNYPYKPQGIAVVELIF